MQAAQSFTRSNVVNLKSIMKTKIQSLFPMLALLALLTLNSALSTAQAQGTAFTYQGQLNSGGGPATGLYDFQFSLFNALSGGSQVGGTVTNLALGVTNGLFTTTLDFGPVFTGNPVWLAISVRTNGGGGYAALNPLQPLTPAPYAVFAAAAGNLSGTIPASQLSGTVANSQLANHSITITPGTGLSGGGAVALGGSTTLNNTGVLSVTGNGDITASQAGGAVTLGSTATSGNVAGAIVKRDASGNFSAGTITLSGALNMVNSGNNTAVGSSALANNTTGNFNTAYGAGALSVNTNGIFNTGNGAFALYFNNNGSSNTASGAIALYGNTTGADNTANGAAALYLNSTGANNTADGVNALRSNASGNNNTADGQGALYSNTSGGNNVALGYQAGYNLTTGSSNIDIGNLGVAGDNNTIRIGSGQSSTFIAGVIAGNGAGLTNLNASQLIGGAVPSAALPNVAMLTGNQTFSGVITAPGFQSDSGGDFIAGMNNTATGGYATVGGGKLNNATAGSATVCGGYDNTSSGESATVGGGTYNYSTGGDATVGGGYNNYSTAPMDSTVGGGYHNYATNNYATVPGGQYNFAGGEWSFAAGQQAQALHQGAFVWADSQNAPFASTGNDQFCVRAQGGAFFAGAVTATGFQSDSDSDFVAGYGNTASGGRATVGGGTYNYATGGDATVGGGYNNYSTAPMDSTVGGGYHNAATNNYATVPGGQYNFAGGEWSFAAGQQAQALYQGDFVWADSQSGTYSSWANDQFCIRAQGGVQLDPTTSLSFGSATRQMLNLYGTAYGIGVQSGTLFFRSDNSYATSGAFSWFRGGSFNNGQNNPGTGGQEMMRLETNGNLSVRGTVTASSVNLSSDRNLKSNFMPVNAREVLARVSALPITAWNFKNTEGVRHLGPMAQDFYAAFHVGEDDQHIAVVDEGGVALAAIQGLNQKLEEQAKQKDAEIQDLKQSVADLKKLVQTLVEKK